MTEKSIEALLNEFGEATADFESMHERSESAGREETRALNRLNAAQKALDEHFATMRSKAPWNSDWSRDDRHNESAEA